MTRDRETNMWLTRIYPELSQLSSDAERKRLCRNAQRKFKKKMIGSCFAVLFVGIAVAWPTAAYVEGFVGAYLAPLPAWPFRHLTVGLFGAIAGLAFLRLCYKPFRDQIRRDLIARGVLVCLRCGYNLTGLPEPRCPECGQPFEAKGDAT